MDYGVMRWLIGTLHKTGYVLVNGMVKYTVYDFEETFSISNIPFEIDSKVLEEGLLSCANLELWLLYLARVRRSAVAGAGRTEQEARDDTIAAFELALQHVG